MTRIKAVKEKAMAKKTMAKKTQMELTEKVEQTAETDKTVEVEEVNIILRIPKDAAALTVTATVLDGGEPVKMKKNLSVQDIFDARRAFLDNVEDGDDYDGYFVLTDEGKKYLKDAEEGVMPGEIYTT